MCACASSRSANEYCITLALTMLHQIGSVHCRVHTSDHKNTNISNPHLYARPQPLSPPDAEIDHQN